MSFLFGIRPIFGGFFLRLVSGFSTNMSKHHWGSLSHNSGAAERIFGLVPQTSSDVTWVENMVKAGGLRGRFQESLPL